MAPAHFHALSYAISTSADVLLYSQVRKARVALNSFRVGLKFAVAACSAVGGVRQFKKRSLAMPQNNRAGVR